MHLEPWTLKEPIEFFFFDCDSTLSLIEGIDVLASMNGVGPKVRQITERCMAETGLNIDAYRERLDLVQPTPNQLEQLAVHYKQNCTPGVYEVIQTLHRLHKKVFIISAGIKNPVTQFAKTLGIKANEVLAVEVYFDERGRYKGFDEQSNLVKAHGKTTEIAALLDSKQRALLVGDGISDLEAREAVTRFIGFGGVQIKEQVKKHADFYIETPSFYSILPLGLTVSEVKKLSEQDKIYYTQGLSDIGNAFVDIQENNHVYDPGS